ncbi:MAG: YrrS family protein [Bacillales bacterium]|nr:YrrS family protein [Bacillales bacterium]
MNEQYPSRSEKRLKRKKTNRILNTAIVVVIILIILVAFSIFSGGNDEETSKKTNHEPKTSQQETSTVNKDKQEKHTKKEKEKKKKEKVIVEQGGGPNVEETIKDPNWEPVATQQSGEHVSSFDTNSVDWKEKVKALSYATGIPEDNMTVWFISGQGPDKAIGTVSPKGRKNDAYRVYIEWVDGKGWKPVQVEKLIHNDKGM